MNFSEYVFGFLYFSVSYDMQELIWGELCSLLLLLCHSVFFFFFVFLLFLWAAPTAHGGTQARGRIGAVAASLHHSHSNARSELCLQPAPQLPILNPLSEARDGTCVLMGAI